MNFFILLNYMLFLIISPNQDMQIYKVKEILGLGAISNRIFICQNFRKCIKKEKIAEKKENRHKG